MFILKKKILSKRYPCDMENLGVHEINLKKVYNKNSRGLSMDRERWANQDLRSIQRKRGLKRMLRQEGRGKNRSNDVTEAVEKVFLRNSK